MLFNQWTGCGRLGRDPEMNYTPNGKAVTKFSIAVDQGKDQPTMWLNIVAWERLAERIAETAQKGNEMFIQGRLTMRTYDDRNGQKRQAFDVIATSAQLTQRPQQKDAAGTDDDGLGDLEDHPF